MVKYDPRNVLFYFYDSTTQRYHEHDRSHYLDEHYRLYIKGGAGTHAFSKHQSRFVTIVTCTVERVWMACCGIQC